MGGLGISGPRSHWGGGLGISGPRSLWGEGIGILGVGIQRGRCMC